MNKDSLDVKNAPDSEEVINGVLEVEDVRGAEKADVEVVLDAEDE